MDNLLLLFQAPTILVQLVVDGLLVGAIFALAAYGMALVWGVMNIINISQGEYVILGGYISYFLYRQFGLHPLLSLPIAGLVLFLLGVLLYRLVIHRIVGRDMFISLLATFGISILLQQLMNELFGPDVVSVAVDMPTWYFLDNTVTVPTAKLLAFGVVLAIAALLVVGLRYSRLGQAIRATAQNARAARVLGVNTDRVYAATYGLNAALCGMAGSLVVMIWVIHPFIGLTYTVRSFMIVIVAGLGNLPGVFATGLGLGALEQIAGFVLGAEFQSAFVFSLLVVILIVRNAWLRRRREYLS
ncbi:branched-chain amino acid ABC transporter permease [Acidihalobacter yilgarnensis]|uniref:Branched-chain amino acid ABC transporter permease n=1 Tax=Acidihalobacter yilgarnensis TaxID=2819280 RepID=A0A1D8IK05_9GAMM|nr:branched-chain amino acid ABC transporter permease [Acidihalobacter yilgarnensis]AOU96792.1 branched-chain amino acid ABC transporter permease [Acidihalobacter yilgarnensis]